jgi:RNA polymerase sigma-70 factor, ECF subfamily
LLGRRYGHKPMASIVRSGVDPIAEASSDGELLQRTRAGDRDAFGTVYERRHNLVLTFLLRRTRDPEIALDLTAETFAAALLALADRPPVITGSALPWLLTIARNALIDSYRRGRVESAARERLALEPVAITATDIEQVLQTAAEIDLLGRLAAELPADQFQALQARVLEERGYEEIARDLDCSAAVVRKRVSRAMSTLRQARGAFT